MALGAAVLPQLGLPAAAGEGGVGGAIGGLFGKVAPAFEEGGKLGAGSIGRGGLYALAGQVAGHGLQKVWNDPNSNWDNAGANALEGAGMGAGIGTMILPGVGTAVGAGLGAIGGGLMGLFGHKSTGTHAVASALSGETSKLNSLMEQLGLPEDMQTQAKLQLQLGVAQATSEDQVKQVSSQLQQQLVASAPAIQQQAATEKMRQANVAAIQSWLSPMLNQQMGQAQGYTNQLADAMKFNAQSLPQGLQANALAQAAQIQQTQANQNSGMVAQLAATPGLYGYSTGQQANGVANNDLQSILMAQQVQNGSQYNPQTGQWAAPSSQ